jgi:uncharacterized protein (TIGR02594 family)
MSIPRWMRVAEDYLGTRTKPGLCAVFVGGCLEASGLPSTQSIKARSYLDYGSELRRPRAGALVILWRREPECSLGHIGFYTGQLHSKVILLGSHQGHVSIKAFSKDRILGYRWPLLNTS